MHYNYLKLAFRIEQRYHAKNLCTDDYDVYKYYSLAERHHTTKSETSLVESFNSLIRNYVARFNRRTKRYSKALHMIIDSLTLLIHKKLLNLCMHL